MIQIQTNSLSDWSKYYFLGSLKEFEGLYAASTSTEPFIKVCRAVTVNPPMVGDKLIWFYIRATDISAYREME